MAVTLPAALALVAVALAPDPVAEPAVDGDPPVAVEPPAAAVGVAVVGAGPEPGEEPPAAGVAKAAHGLEAEGAVREAWKAVGGND